MAVLTRILPRDWDGRRLLRFLAGLALIALSFAVHLGGVTAGPDRPSAATSGPVTSVDAAAHAAARPPDPALPLSVDAAPAAPAAPTHADPTRGDVARGDVARGDVARGDVADPVLPDRAAVAPAAVGRILALPVPAALGLSGSRARMAPLAATAPGAHGSRAPPRV